MACFIYLIHRAAWEGNYVYLYSKEEETGIQQFVQSHLITRGAGIFDDNTPLKDSLTTECQAQGLGTKNKCEEASFLPWQSSHTV